MQDKYQDLRQTSQYAQYMSKIGWKVEKLSNGQAFIRPVPILGTLIKIQRINLPIPYQEIDQLAKKHKAAMVKIEPATSPDQPVEEYKQHGYKYDKFPLVPTKTYILDLNKSEDELFASLEKDTRNSIRRAYKNNLEVKTATENAQSVTIEVFAQEWQTAAQKKGFAGPNTKELTAMYEAFKESTAAELIFIYTPDKQLVSGCMLLLNKENQSTHYIHAFSTERGKQLFASYLLVWESIHYAKNKWNSNSFDLEGIYDSRFHSIMKKWQGFTLFKKGFAGKEYSYTGAYTKYLNPFLKIMSYLPF